MAKYFVVHGSVANGGAPVVVGGSVDMDDAKAKELVASGFLLDEKSYLARRKGLEGMVESGGALSHKDNKLAKALGLVKSKAPESKEKK